jgi:thiol-disulfide isomerase/thioredoxin
LIGRRGELPVEGPFPSLRGATDWLNSAQLDPKDVRGKVVVVNFCTYTCINWLRTLPYVRAWAQTYERHGLVVIGVHTPEFSFEHDLENVRTAAPWDRPQRAREERLRSQGGPTGRDRTHSGRRWAHQ